MPAAWRCDAAADALFLGELRCVVANGRILNESKIDNQALASAAGMTSADADIAGSHFSRNRMPDAGIMRSWCWRLFMAKGKMAGVSFSIDGRAWHNGVTVPGVAEDAGSLFHVYRYDAPLRMTPRRFYALMRARCFYEHTRGYFIIGLINRRRALSSKDMLP